MKVSFIRTAQFATNAGMLGGRAMTNENKTLIQGPLMPFFYIVWHQGWLTSKVIDSVNGLIEHLTESWHVWDFRKRQIEPCCQ